MNRADNFYNNYEYKNPEDNKEGKEPTYEMIVEVLEAFQEEVIKAPMDKATELMEFHIRTENSYTHEIMQDIINDLYKK